MRNIAFIPFFLACGDFKSVSADGGQITVDGGLYIDGGSASDGGIDGGCCCYVDGGQITVDGGLYIDGGSASDGGIDGGDPLSDYQWLNGQWRCVEKNGGVCPWHHTLQTVLVANWDSIKGAEVRGFTPLAQCYIKKNPETLVYELSARFNTGSYANGTADENFLKVEFDYHSFEPADYKYTYLKE